MGTYTMNGKIISHCKTSPESLLLGRVLVCWHPFPVWVVLADQEDILFHPCSLLWANSVSLRLFPHYSLPGWMTVSQGAGPVLSPRKTPPMTVTSVQGCYNSVLASVGHTWLLALGGGTTSLFSGGQTAAFLLHSGGVQCEVPGSQSLPTWQRPVPP